MVEADPTEITVSFHCCGRSGIVAFEHYHGNEINKSLHSNGHKPNITHMGGPEHKRLRRHLPNDLPTRFMV
jgi:hypothetical protein